MLRVLAAFGLLLPGAAVAQEQDIVVTGRGLPRASGDAVYSTVVIGRDRLTGSASGRLDEILREVPGFQLFRRSDARSANPTSQGATLRALGGNASSRALLILDGVPQSDPFGGWINWPAYDPDRLGAVRVVRGGGAGASGPGALAGTIELSSAEPADLAGLRGALAYGSRDSIDGGSASALRWAAASSPARPPSPAATASFPSCGGSAAPPTAPHPMRRAASLCAPSRPSAAGPSSRRARSCSATGASAALPSPTIATLGADASLRLVGAAWEALAYVQTREYRNEFASVSADRSSVGPASEQYNVPSTGLGGRIEARPRLGPLDLRLGADTRLTRGVTRELFSFVNGAGTRGREAGGRTATIGAFAEASAERGPLTLTAGARVDRWRIEGGFLREQLLATGAPLRDEAYEDRSGWEPTAPCRHRLASGRRGHVRGAAYLGWRLPTLNELYRPFRVGPDATAANPALSPSVCGARRSASTIARSPPPGSASLCSPTGWKTGSPM
jgi:hypothetical protein